MSNKYMQRLHLLRLLQLSSEEINGSLSNTTDLKEAIALAQKNWLRPKGKERWELSDSSLLLKNKIHILGIAAQLGFINEIKPKKKCYDSVIIFGASDTHLLSRFHYLHHLWLSGVRFSNLYLLTGNWSRPNEASDTYFALAIYKALKKNWPEELKNKKLISIIGTSHHPGRPNTKDTLIAWLAEKKEKMNQLLLISNQPFIFYQNAVAQNVLQSDYAIETVGSRIDPETLLSVILDSIARYLYETNYEENSR